MAKKNRSVPQYGTVTRKGILYYRTRIQDADGKQVSLYATTCEELYEKQLAAKKQAADTRADAFKGAKAYGSKDLFNAVVARMRDRMAIKSGGMGNDRKDVVDAIQGAVKQLTELLPSGADTSWYAERADAKRCFSIFEKTVGHIDLTAPGCGGPDDVKVRIGLSLAKKEIASGLDGTPSGAALSAIFEEWDSQPEEESETD